MNADPDKMAAPIRKLVVAMWTPNRQLGIVERAVRLLKGVVASGKDRGNKEGDRLADAVQDVHLSGTCRRAESDRLWQVVLSG